MQSSLSLYPLSIFLYLSLSLSFTRFHSTHTDTYTFIQVWEISGNFSQTLAEIMFLSGKPWQHWPWVGLARRERKIVKLSHSFCIYIPLPLPRSRVKQKSRCAGFRSIIHAFIIVDYVHSNAKQTLHSRPFISRPISLFFSI